MAYKILTQNSTDNTNIDGARAEHFNAGMRDGIIKGAFNEGTFTTLASNEISFDTCELRISGHRVVVDEAWTRTFSTKPATPTRYALIGQIIVGEDSSVQFDLFPQLASTALIKNNLFRQQNGSGTYQVEIGRFTLNTDGNIIDVTRTLDIITGSKGEDLDGTINIGVVTTNTLEPEMEAEVDVEQRYDAEQKKVVTDFNFNIPRGKGIENLDDELSESSTNAVQNNVITNALKNKADKSEIPDISGKADKSEIPDISGKADKSEIPDISGKADKSEIPDISGKADKSEVTTAMNNAKSKCEKIATYIGYASGNHSLDSGKAFSDYHTLIFVFWQTATNKAISLTLPTGYFTTGNECEANGGNNRYMVFKYVNDNTYSIVSSSYVEFRQIWGIR